MADLGDIGRAGAFAGQYMVDGVYRELIGLCRGILSDRELRDAEVVALHDWLATYARVIPEWPGQILARRVQAILADGIVEEEERTELQAFLEQAAGMEGTDRFDAPTTLPLTRPAPHVVWTGKRFCMTGTFLYGPRKSCEAATVEQGGTCSKNWYFADYLVIGGAVTAAWKYGTHGLKIQEAMEAIQKGRELAIIAESHWHSSFC